MTRIVVLGWLAAALLGSLALGAAAQSSCQAFYSQCSSRCQNVTHEPPAKCVRDHCGPKLASCRRSGCWTEGAQHGGLTSCDLKKS